MAEAPSPRPSEDAPAPPKTRPGQWALLIVGALLHGAGSTLLLTAALASLIPEPGEWKFWPYYRVDYMTEWDAQQATQWWEQLQDTIPTLLIIGAAALVVGVVALLFGAAGLGRDIDPQRTAPAGGGGTAGLDSPGAGGVSAGSVDTAQRSSVYPVRLTGHLDAPSRALWLVKWLLAIPHYIVLALLWLTAFVTTLAAGLVILFTGRYPRAWFCFNVGVLRWSWRVGFYGYSALATDRYPPFTLASADYPADLSIAYPERLSHWMVLVKSWLFAIPHLLLIGIFTTPSGTGWQSSWEKTGSGTGQTTGSGGGFSLLGLLLLITVIILLFTRRYPRGIFDFVMGLNRWGNRVAAYVLLMRDEYPPFRLDQGPVEPGPDPHPNPGAAPDRTRSAPATWTDWV
ncbi:DUF4389 domain-containing protein [Nesterenkonia aurantiaca]|uniref:Uncharacterized protein DUF4389 n=1 Tax=Nesterenkonia aurantiaca TaxID=1436010 RepID=A0A4R7G4R4_9MICC|nr:DUF4389 domain-containing protein [Nesterenkonia aurantiaca]TDS86331.1 uncharacterized protein DUF4389 [Nesterenkonia aurantiaca]